VKRKKELRSDPAKTEAWLQRGAANFTAKQIERARSGLGKQAPKPRRRSAKKQARNDGPWRLEVFARRGGRCRCCGDTMHVQADHMIPRSQGGPSIVENGLPLCSEFGKGQCHLRKTNHELLIRRDWLDADQVEWLRASGNAWWEEDGTVAGRHNRLFAPVEEGKT
jgi:5-methylcytosine-specific restriction endonuclease McrA